MDRKRPVGGVPDDHTVFGAEDWKDLERQCSPEPDPNPEPSFWWRLFWWPLSPHRHRNH